MWRFARFLPSFRRWQSWTGFPRYIRWRLVLVGVARPDGRILWRRMVSREFLTALWRYHRWLGEMDRHRNPSSLFPSMGEDTGGG